MSTSWAAKGWCSGHTDQAWSASTLRSNDGVEDHSWRGDQWGSSNTDGPDFWTSDKSRCSRHADQAWSGSSLRSNDGDEDQSWSGDQWGSSYTDGPDCWNANKSRCYKSDEHDTWRQSVMETRSRRETQIEDMVQLMPRLEDNMAKHVKEIRADIINMKADISSIKAYCDAKASIVARTRPVPPPPQALPPAFAMPPLLRLEDTSSFTPCSWHGNTGVVQVALCGSSVSLEDFERVYCQWTSTECWKRGAMAAAMYSAIKKCYSASHVDWSGASSQVHRFFPMRCKTCGVGATWFYGTNDSEERKEGSVTVLLQFLLLDAGLKDIVRI